MLTLGSLFDGIGGWCLAAQHNGVKPVWSSEIEKFPLAVTRIRFPDVKQLGDIRKIDGGNIEPVDIICAGSPCQDLSVAGFKKGLEGQRSGLFRDAIRIIRQMRMSTGWVHCRYYIWENVVGALSSNEGMDFRSVIELLTNAKVPIPRSGKWANAGLVRSGLCDVGWRVLNSEYFGVPCRRRRLFLIADYHVGERRAGEILFERKDDRKNVQMGKRKKQTDSQRDEKRIGKTVKDVTVWENHQQDSRITGPHKIAPTLSTWEDDVPLVFDEKNGMIVRKLTPVEVERLHGLPDNYTYLPGNKLCNDSARYKAIGNGMAQPCADWIIQRIVEVTKEDEKC